MANQQLDKFLIGLVDTIHAVIPRALPSAQQLKDARIISHRGERQQEVEENTFAAFDRLRGSGVWGLECDVRWSADQVPLVFHDPDFRRLYGDAQRLRELSAAQIQQRFPAVPTLQDWVSRYGEEFHLMVELKAEPYPNPESQGQQLMRILESVNGPGFHFICLQPELLQQLRTIPAHRTVNVARFNAAALSTEALAQQRAGIAGHYQLIRSAIVTRHRQAAQNVGSGYPASEAVLRRELSRGVNWIFSNEALRMQRALERLRRRCAASTGN